MIVNFHYVDSMLEVIMKYKRLLYVIEVIRNYGQYVKNLLYMESLTSVKYHCMANVICLPKDLYLKKC